MAPSTSASVPPGQHAPVAVVSEVDHSAWILICNAFGLIVVLITLIIRGYLRVKVSPPIGKDDWILAAGTALAVIQVSIVFKQVDAGFGRSIKLIDQGPLEEVQKLGFAADVLFLTTLYTSKCCVVMFFKRISPSRTDAIFAWAVLGMCLIFAVVSILVVSLRCNLSQPWIIYVKSCSGLQPRWQAATAMDVVSEIVVFAMSIQLVWNLQTSFARKATVVFAFGLRLFMIMIAGIRLHYIEQQLASSDPTLSGAITAILTQVELFYGLVAATIPCLRPFLSAFVTNYGSMGGETIMGGSAIGGTVHVKGSKASKTSIALQSIDSARRTTGMNEKTMDSTTSWHNGAGMLRPDQVSNQFSAGHVKGGRSDNDVSSVDSDESTRRMIIKKSVAWQVDSESFRDHGGPDAQDGGAPSER